MEKTERIQYQAALAITGAWQGSCHSNLYQELGWESLSDRSWCRRILQMHKIVSDKMPSYLKNKLPRLRRPLCRQSNSNTFPGFKCKSLRYKSSFFPDATTSWNNVITHFNDIPSFNVLKNHILSLIRPKEKCIFGTIKTQNFRRKKFRLKNFGGNIFGGFFRISAEKISAEQKKHLLLLLLCCIFRLYRQIRSSSMENCTS